MTDQDPTAARNAYLARVLANPPTPRYPCAADCGKPLTQWHTDAQGRHWHPDCLPTGTPMPVSAEERIRQLEAQLAELNNAINWDTTCLSCARTLDSCYAETMRAEQADAEAARLRAGMEDLFTRWFLNAHAGLGLREAMMGIAADLRSILDNPTRTTPDNPQTSSDAVDNPEPTP